MHRPPKKFVPVPFAYHQEIELAIDSLTNLGAGVGRIAGWVVFVPFSLPGEKVRARVFRNDRNCSHADLVEVLEPSPDRREPFCPLFGQCGGCQYQHLTYATQLAWKSRQVGELMRHMAGIDHPVNDCVSTAQTTHYRSKITPHFEKPRDGELGPIGFLALGRRSQLVDVPQCPLAMDAINAALPALRDGLRRRAKSFKRGATVLLRATADGVATDPNAVVTERVGGLAFQFLAGDFFQNNPFILPAFTGYVAEQAAGDGIRFLVDAYCGSGLFALCLAARFDKVVGVEVSETSCAWARRNAEANGIANAEFLTAAADAVFGAVAFPPEHTCVVIDPPRKGCDAEFLAQLFAFGPARVIYVSCDPATQVRDLKQFVEHGYQLTEVQPFDLFPHTRHLECVMTLVRP
ncbi:MAG: class I SAM-dependent RNA methyltransferase [Akkermansiaceae bacterium]|jgi:23S rRNA (uracil1939-C5)-methyltransferase/tRNA (uracil-5-)-methyltransferase|nr:class I SAM-dependent RNA methyltransferase [Akkermansiaceae bacterium]